jgi:gliding motility-associated-like protein
VTVLDHPAGVIQATLATTDVLCFSDSNGTAIINATGGSMPYTYSWSTGATTASISGLPAGNYNYEVADTNGCTFQSTFIINEPVALSSSAVLSNYNGFQVSTQGGTDGSIDLSVSGGTAPYSYSWSNGSALEDQSGLGAGTYIVMVTDTNGCSISDTVLLSEPDGLSVEAIVSSDNICPDGQDGIIYAAISGGVGPFTITWLNGYAGDSLSGLPSGLYIVTVIDTNGSFATDSAYILALDEDCDGIYNVDEGGIPGAGGGLADLDGDGIPNQQDTDSDGDGIADALEFDSNNDGIPFDDCDGDGYPDFLDADLCDLKPASAMTPDGDGLNDFWEIPRITQYPGTAVQIFNRQGILVYRNDNYANEFNGNANVQTVMTNGTRELPTGTYYYLIQLGGTEQTMNGYIYINR